MQNNNPATKLSKGKKIKFVFFTLLFLLTIIIIVSEIILAIVKYPSTYDKMQQFSFNQAKWWACDSINGPRYVANQVTTADSVFLKDQIWYYNRLKIVNNEGYHDRVDFNDIPANNDSLKILITGDSFTWGASADVDSSFVDVFKRDIKQNYPSIIWNTGIPATGTNHALFATQKFLPLQKSNYVILGFYTGNDFSDNLMPFDRLVFNDLTSCYNLYDLKKDLQPFSISKKDAYKKATGSYPIEELNIFQKLLTRSRFVTWFGDMKDKLLNRINGNKKRLTEKEYEVTREFLKRLDDYTKENNAELIVEVIPTSYDLKEKSNYYLKTIELLKDLSIKYIDNDGLFTQNDYVYSGGHWSNRGHIKAGQLLSKYLIEYIQKKQHTNFKK